MLINASYNKMMFPVSSNAGHQVDGFGYNQAGA
jgi:hypothetical protein